MQHLQNLTLRKERDMDVQEKFPLRISADMSIDNTYVHTISNYSDPDYIISKIEADMAVMAVENSLITIS